MTRWLVIGNADLVDDVVARNDAVFHLAAAVGVHLITDDSRREIPMASEYVGIDLHRRRSVIVRQDADGETLERVRIDNDPVALGCAIERAGSNAEVVVEATYGRPTAGIGRSTCCRPPARKCIWRIRWA